MRALLLALVTISMAGCAHEAGGALPMTAGAAPVAAPALSGLRVSGNKLVDGSNNVVHLRGINRSGTEYACVQGWGIFDGPSDAASVEAMTTWHVNVVRVLLNEDCWLAINGIKAKYAGKPYRRAIVELREPAAPPRHVCGSLAGLGRTGNYKATSQPAAPDEDHSPAMWSSMASAFKDDPNVILAPWSETTVDWGCFMQKRLRRRSEVRSVRSVLPHRADEAGRAPDARRGLSRRHFASMHRFRERMRQDERTGTTMDRLG